MQAHREQCCDVSVFAGEGLVRNVGVGGGTPGGGAALLYGANGTRGILTHSGCMSVGFQAKKIPSRS